MAIDLILGGKDRLQEISMKLEQSHLVYLQADESPLKLQQRHKLEGFIKEYLCLVPNESKYIFQETAEILRRSAAALQDFSGYRAATAWSAISLYAANLMAQPWRKEYRTLRTYSGYYRHEVQANLVGAELMFELMGYKHADREVLVLEGPVDPDKVTNVSRDAIVAFVECQILKQIWECVSQNYTWLEILEFRENHVGTPEQAIRALDYRFREKMHQNRIKAESYRDLHYPPPTNVNTMPSPYSYHIPPSNYSVTPCPYDPRYINDMCMIPKSYRYCNVMDNPLNHYGTYGYMPAAEKCATIHGSSYYHGVPTFTTKVPTGKLVELNMPLSVMGDDRTYGSKPTQRSLNLDEVDFHKRHTDSDSDYAKVDKKYMKSNSTIEKNNTNDTWDFIYEKLESEGYSKDLGDREDVLKKKIETRPSKQKPYRISEKEDKYQTYRSERRKSSRTDSKETNSHLTNGKKHHETLPFKKKSFSFDLSDSNKHYADSSTESQAHTYDTIRKHGSSMSRSHNSAEQISRITNSINDLDLTESKKKEERIGGKDKWSCSTCTFLNVPETEICEICSKSRFKGNEDKPLASGGKECPKCTLVNERNATVCDACNESLKDSPTYI